MPVPLIGAAIGAGGSILSGVLGSRAASKAASQQQAALQKAIDTTSAAVAGGQKNVGDNVAIANDLLQKAADTYNPYADVGTNNLSSLQDLVKQFSGQGQFSFNPTDLQSDPGYQFTLQQGQQAIQRAAAAQGGLFSSGTLKSLAGYTTGTAEQYFNDAFNRALNTYTTNTNTGLSKINSLQNLVNFGYGANQARAGIVGKQADNSIAGAEFGSNLGLEGAQIIGNALAGQGNAAAAGTIGSNNALTAGIAGAANAVGGGLNTVNANNTLQNLLALNSPSPVTTSTFPQTPSVNTQPYQYYNPSTGGMSTLGGGGGYFGSNTQGGGIQ
jgi:hypothetical protein